VQRRRAGLARAFAGRARAARAALVALVRARGRRPATCSLPGDPWLAIEPRPVVGAPSHDATQHLLNCTARLCVDRAGTVARFCQAPNVKQERVHAWLCAPRRSRPAGPLIFGLGDRGLMTLAREHEALAHRAQSPPRPCTSRASCVMRSRAAVIEGCGAASAMEPFACDRSGRGARASPCALSHCSRA
jgi:hypothetical protein